MAHTTRSDFSLNYSSSFPFHPSPSQPCPPHPRHRGKWGKNIMNKGVCRLGPRTFWQNKYRYFRGIYVLRLTDRAGRVTLSGVWPFQPVPTLPSNRKVRGGRHRQWAESGGEIGDYSWINWSRDLKLIVWIKAVNHKPFSFPNRDRERRKP